MADSLEIKRTLTGSSMYKLYAEVEFARTKFPNPHALVAALFEEFAEWCGEDDDAKKRKELLQIACVAMRLYEETDPLEDHPLQLELKCRGVMLESLARAIIEQLVGTAAAARSTESESATEIRIDQQ